MEEVVGRQPKASIIIPVFNKIELTKRCIAAIRQGRSKAVVEIIVVDNCSTDGTSSWLRRQESDGQVRTIRNDENLGFVDACNLGAKAAAGDYLIFLNNDTEPQDGWLDALLNTVERDDAVGAVGAKLVYPDGRLQEAGGIIFSDGSGWNYGRGGDPGDPRYNFVREVDYCSGACLLVRTTVFHRLGGFDTRFAPAYYEDTDLCFAVRASGYKVIYQPAATIIHHEGATAGTDLSAGMKRYQQVNRIKFAEKWATQLAGQCSPNPTLVRKASARVKGKRILVIDPLMPIFDRASGSKRLYEMLKILVSAGHFVTFIARNGTGQEQYIDILQQLGVETYSTDPAKLRQAGHSVQGRPIDLPRLLRDTHYDLAILSFYYIAEQYLDEIRRNSPATVVVVDTVDVHFLREERQAQIEGNAELRRRAAVTKRREVAIYGRADALITVTEEDRAHLERELPCASIYVIPNIHEVSAGVLDRGSRDGLLFVGNFRHLPNVDAVKFFCDEVLPRIRARLPHAKLTIVGDSPPTELTTLTSISTGIAVTGYVPDVGPYLQSHMVSVAPLRYGAGLKGKIGEALANGLPAVTTSIGFEGMGLPEQQEVVLVADSPDEFAEAVIRVYEDENLWTTLSQNGRAHVDAHYSVAAVSQMIGRMLDGATAAGTAMRERRADAGRPRPSVAAVYCVYDDDAWLVESVESVYEHCDAIYILVSDSPWHGEPGDNSQTLEIIGSLSDPAAKIHVVRGNWSTEHDQRNAGLEILQEDHIAYCLVVDGDEVYDPSELKAILDLAAAYPEVTCWHAKMDTYWKSFRYRIDPREPSAPAVLVKCGGATFTRYRSVRAESHLEIPTEIGRLHHLSYARTDAQLRRKIATFSHAHELVPDWLENVWERWDRDHSLTNLNPLTPTDYQRAMPQPYSELPSVLKLKYREEEALRADNRESLVSIIILTHNLWSQTRLCLESIERHTPQSHEIIVVDNGSTDETPSRLRELSLRNSRLRVILNRTNLGFAKGNNLGLAIASGDYVVLLNNDTVVTEGWLGSMLAALAADPDAGIVGPMSNSVSGPQLVPNAPYKSLADMPPFAKRWAKLNSGQTQRVVRIVGFCLMARREVVEWIGGLDEQFGSGNFEDDDYCLRALFAGYGAVIATDSFVHHSGSRTFRAAGIDWTQAMRRNWELFKAKWKAPADATLEDGYRVPGTIPEGLALHLPLPDIRLSHVQTSDGAFFEEITPTVTVLVQAEGSDSLASFLDRLSAITFPLNVTIVDSAAVKSTDGSCLFGRLPQGGSLVEYSDLSLASLLNTAVKSDEDAPIVLISSDSVLLPQVFDNLVASIKRNPGVAILGPVSNNAPSPQRLRADCGRSEKKIRRLAERLSSERAGQVREAPYLGAFCLFFNPRACRAIGQLREDTDISHSLWEYFHQSIRAGYALGIALDSYVHHDCLSELEGAGFDELAAAQAEIDRMIEAGRAAMEAENLEAAEHEFRALVTAFPGLGVGHAALGSCLIAQGKLPDAVLELKRAIDISPTPDLYNQLGVAQFQIGEPAEAERAFREALTPDTCDIQPILNLIDLFRSQERYVEATQAVKEAMHVDPNHPEVFVALATLSLELGDLEAGEMALHRLQSVSPEHPACSIVQAAIQEIRNRQVVEEEATSFGQVAPR